MLRLFLLTLLAVLGLSAAPAYAQLPPNVTPPLTGAEKVTCNRSGVNYSCTTAQLATSVPATGPYTNQLPQTLQTVTNYPYLNILTFLTAANQAKVLAGTATTSDFDALQIFQYAAAAFSYNNGTRTIYAPCGKYPFSAIWDWRLGIDVHGEGTAGSPGGGNSGCTVFSWPANTAGIKMHAHDSTTPGTGFGWSLSNVVIASAGGTDQTKHGVTVNATGSMNNVTISNFPGDNLHVEANTGTSQSDPTHGNANSSSFRNVTLLGNGVTTNNAFIQGTDVNNMYLENVQSFSANGFCFYDNSFLGLTVSNLGMASCGLKGLVNYNPGSGITSYYAGVSATRSQLQTTTPGTNSAIWTPYGSNGGFPTWTNGGDYLPGGTAVTVNTNSPTIYTGTYTEGGGAPIYLGNKGCSFGGLSGGIGCTIGASQGIMYAGLPLASGQLNGSIRVYGLLGESNGTGLSIFTTNADGSGGGGFALGAEYRMSVSGGDIFEQIGFGAGNIFGIHTGTSTTETFGGTTTVPLAGGWANLLVGDGNVGGINPANWRVLRTCSATPSTVTLARGNICFNRSISAGGIADWRLLTSAATDIYIANYLNERASPSTGIGYVTGAGGTVTQASSRTTGVTLNTSSGDVVVLSAAGSATPFSFTVTNSAIGAHDTVSLTITGATTDKYRCDAQIPAAGSFIATCVDLTGTATEAFTLHFNRLTGAISLNDNEPLKAAA